MSKYNKEYFSDDEISENDDNNNEINISKDKNEELSGYEESEDESMDEETRNIIFNKVSNINYDLIQYPTTVKTKNKDKSKSKGKDKHISLIDFNKKIEEDAKSKITKKFTSKRVNDKKKSLGITEELPKRSFNPRLPPYNFVHNVHDRKLEENVNINNTEEFPTL